MRLALAFAFALAVAGCEAAPVIARGSGQATPPGTSPQIELSGRVIDRAEILSAGAERRLTELSASLEKATTDQLVVVTLDTLNGASIEQVGYALGTTWGVGQEDFDNGVLLLVAPNERKVRIEVGLGLEGLLTDARAAEIVRDIMPSLRKDMPDQAMLAGAGAIAQLLRSDPRRPQGRPA